MQMKIILASSSPRRAEVLRDAGIAFEVRATHVDEAAPPGEPAETMVARLAEAKARAAAEQIGSSEGSCIVIGADTSVELDCEIFGKPRDPRSARNAGCSRWTHPSCSHGDLSFAVTEPCHARRCGITSVTFAPLAPHEIEAYVATGEPMDKAGAYGIQGVAGRYISRIEGCYFNVVGLPLARLHALLHELGWQDEK